MTRIAPLADVKARLSAYIEKSQTQGPIVITRNGKAVAVLVSPVDDDDVESLVLARSPATAKTSQKITNKYRGRAEGSPLMNFRATCQSRAGTLTRILSAAGAGHTNPEQAGTAPDQRGETR